MIERITMIIMTHQVFITFGTEHRWTSQLCQIQLQYESANAIKVVRFGSRKKDNKEKKRSNNNKNSCNDNYTHNPTGTDHVLRRSFTFLLGGPGFDPRRGRPLPTGWVGVSIM